MEIDNATPGWNSDDIALFRQFLETPTGKRLIPALAHDAPALFGEGDTNKILIRNGEMRGFQQALQSLLAKAYPAPEPVRAPEAFPPLENDAAWNDGNKLT